MTRKPSFITGAILGCFAEFFGLIFVDLIVACLFNGVPTPAGAWMLLSTFPEMFFVKGALGTITGTLAGAAYMLFRQGKERGAGTLALIGGGINLVLLLIWVMSFLLSGQVRGIPPIFVAVNILEPTLPAFALILWGLWSIVNGKGTLNESASVKANLEKDMPEQSPISSPF
jgi:hypothetical protein